jgi:hypothetical protein
VNQQSPPLQVEHPATRFLLNAQLNRKLMLRVRFVELEEHMEAAVVSFVR